MIMTDFCREPATTQAERLPLLACWVRRLCYLLAQKGDPTRGIS